MGGLEYGLRGSNPLPFVLEAPFRFAVRNAYDFRMASGALHDLEPVDERSAVFSRWYTPRDHRLEHTLQWVSDAWHPRLELLVS